VHLLGYFHNQGSCSIYERHFLLYDENNASKSITLQNTVLFINYEWSLSVTLHTTQRTNRRLAAGRCNIRLPSTLLRRLTSDEHSTDPKYVTAYMQVYSANIDHPNWANPSEWLWVTTLPLTKKRFLLEVNVVLFLKTFFCQSASTFVLLPSTFSFRMISRDAL
jgi:hypothetical protein